MTSLRSLLWDVLAFGALPAWLLAGAADWLCHRRARIEATSGPRESVLHLVLFLQIAIPVVLGLWLEITLAVLALMTLAVAAHSFTSWWDTSVAQPRRHIAPIEQLVHGWLEMLPVFALAILAVLHADEFTHPRWSFELRDPLPAALRAGVLLALAAARLCIVEELLRGWRAARHRA